MDYETTGISNELHEGIRMYEAWLSPLRGRSVRGTVRTLLPALKCRCGVDCSCPVSESVHEVEGTLALVGDPIITDDSGRRWKIDLRHLVTVL